MGNISEDCAKHLREIDKRLQMISSAAARESRLGTLTHAAILEARRLTDDHRGLDDDCREILRGVDGRLEGIRAAAFALADYMTIHRLVRETRAMLPVRDDGHLGVPIGG